MKTSLQAIWSTLRTPVELRLFSEYGAIFVSAAIPPPGIIFSDSAEVRRFQTSLPTRSDRFGEHLITLQSEALDALVAARRMLERDDRSVNARAQDAGARSYEETVALWNRNVGRGLEKWQADARITEERAESIRALAPAAQIPLILELEEKEGIYFGTFFDKSILYSVAAPGASQHLSMLAFDVAEHQDEAVESALGRQGWHRTVPNDLPHFTYLGSDEGSLPGLGLKRISRDYASRPYHFWVPNLEYLESLESRIGRM